MPAIGKVSLGPVGHEIKQIKRNRVMPCPLTWLVGRMQDRRMVSRALQRCQSATAAALLGMDAEVMFTLQACVVNGVTVELCVRQADWWE
jgi:hypothetical protein